VRFAHSWQKGTDDGQTIPGALRQSRDAEQEPGLHERHCCQRIREDHLRSGQDSVDASGTIVGKGDFQAQSAQVLKNIQAALAAAGADLHHLIKWNMFVVQGHDLGAGLAVFQKAWGDRPNPPAISFAFVAGLANPDFLIEMDAIAVVPE
jgi:enamine deaminase RidA (YjgF/YER057c/UK114 family)